VLRITLKEDEEAILVSHYKKSNCRLTRERAHALLLSGQGESPPNIAKILFRAENTVREWIKSFHEKRISSLFTGYEGNTNAGKLTKEQKDEIKKALQQPPSEYGIPKEFWSVDNLKTYIKAKFGVVYESDRSYHFILQFGNLSFKLPSPFDIRRDEKFIETRMEEIRKEIKPFLEDSSWEVFVSDETRIMWENEIRRAWLKRGQKTVLKIHRNRDAQNFIGMLSLKTGKPYLYPIEWQNQKTITAALKQFKARCHKEHICIIWDNAKWHKGTLIRRELSKGKSLENFHLINFPPYAPDKNPQEHVWKNAKEKIANKDMNSLEEIVSSFTKMVLGRKYDYKV